MLKKFIALTGAVVVDGKILVPFRAVMEGMGFGDLSRLGKLLTKQRRY